MGGGGDGGGGVTAMVLDDLGDCGRQEVDV